MYDTVFTDFIQMGEVFGIFDMIINYDIDNGDEEITVLNVFIEGLGAIVGKLLGMEDIDANCQEISDWINNYFDNAKKEDKYDVYDLQEKLRNKFPIWKDRILNNLKKTKTKQLISNTLLNPEKLAKGPQEFFDNKIWHNLVTIVREDLSDACQCILVGAFTPAAMITMRCIESALRDYYRIITGDEPINFSWGKIIKILHNNSNADQKLLGYLDYLKDIRNTLEHPDARYSQSEAEDVLQHAFYILKIVYQ